MNEFDPSVIDWSKLMERKNLFFVGLAFTEVESKEINEILGFNLQYFLFKFTKGNWTTFKSAKEFIELYKHIAGIMKADGQRLFKLAEKGAEYNMIASEYIHNHLTNPTEVCLDNFEKEYQLYCNILLYGVTIPWDVIGAIESMSEDERQKYQDLLNAFEPLRAVSLYPDFEREVLQKYRVLLSGKYSIDVSLLSLLTPQELKNVLRGELFIDIELLKKRYEYTVFWYNPKNGEVEFTYDRAIESQIPILQEEKIEDQHVLKGTIAYKGMVIGKVRVLYEQEDCKNFQEGEIIVSPSTNPSLMPAIQKCSGIITDEGGMTSHAAIIAREFKKPSVIGTKIATKVLKDGDLVEVDANTGIVRIIK